MAARYSTTFTNLDDVEYKVEILDSEYSGTASDFDFADTSGFLLTHEADENRFTPIIPSSCTIQMMIQVTDAYFIADLSAQSDNRFFLQISRKDTDWKVIWIGEIATDLIEYTDEYYPFPIQLQAFDTLSLLKNIPFPATAGTRKHFIQQLFTLIGKTRILDKLPNPSTVLRTAVQWYESQMFTTSPAATLDPLSQSACYHDAWMYWDDKLGTQYLSCWDVLEQIAYRFGAQFFFEEGAFNFIQVNRPGTSLNFRYYNNAMGKTTGTEYVTFSGANRNEGKFSFVPAIGTAKVIYPFSLGVNSNNLLPSQSTFETAVSIGNIQGGAEEQLLFSGTLNIFMTTSETEPLGEPHVWIFHLKINIGSYYLTNENGYPQWTTNSAKYFKVKSVVIAILKNYSRTIPISFTTPYIPASGAATFQLIRYGFEDELGASFTLPYSYTPTYYASGFTLRLKIDETMFDAGELLFEETNTANSITRYNSTIELPDLILGDGPHEYAKGRIMVYDAGTASWVISEEEWAIDGIGTGININNLLLKEIIAGQDKPRRVFDGTIFNSRGGMIKMVSFDGINFTMRRGTFDAYHGITTGVWVRNSATRGGSTSSEIIINDPAIIDAVFSSGQAVADTYENTVETSETIEGGGIFDSEGSSQIESLSSKTTPVDADVFMIDDSADEWLKKKLSWANLKATAKTYFDGLYFAFGKANQLASVTEKAKNAVADDAILIEDSEASGAKKKMKMLYIKGYLSTVFWGNILNQWGSLTEKISLADNDIMVIEDSAAVWAKKRIKWSTFKSSLYWIMGTYGLKTTSNVGIGTDATSTEALKVDGKVLIDGSDVTASHALSITAPYPLSITGTGDGDQTFTVDSTGTNNAIVGHATSGIGGQFMSDSGIALKSYINPVSTASAAIIAEFIRQTSRTAANGIEGQIRIGIENAAGNVIYPTYLSTKLTDASSGAAQFIIYHNSAARVMIDEYNDLVCKTGVDLRFESYGDGPVIVSADGSKFRITVDNSGNLSTTEI